ncbi:hypothetical protein G7K71_09275 [Desulfofundulus sp. TPOSR]|jgi:hypothetical protein|uniref:hypothetical protein n=1 Tax=Desulfofundulus sp. TPOSR TaxID=2714340 RepID=UPI00140BEEB0|nr:hypothetical protein [Desulfofundulus sp. TPOSR]NHM27171.1 hypothetical protein [Desulfofundulus sp. TPOSR]
MDIKKTYKHLATCLLLGAALVTGAAGCGPKAGPGQAPRRNRSRKGSSRGRKRWRTAAESSLSGPRISRLII